MNFCIDIGNTRAKLGIFKEDKLLEVKILQDISFETILEEIKRHYPQKIILTSVTVDLEDYQVELSKHTEVILFTNQTKLPFQNCYATPKTLGSDRLAGILGAYFLFPFQNCLVMDAGTCLTYDFIDAQNNYWGGGIAPGLQMRFKSLSHFTVKLPLIEDLPSIDKVKLIGNTTESSIWSGVIFGMLAEMEGMIQKYHDKHTPLQVLLSGGDALFFESMINPKIFVSPNLNLIGLNTLI